MWRYYNMCYEKCCEKENKKECFCAKDFSESNETGNNEQEFASSGQDSRQSEWQGDLECCKQLTDIQEKYAHMTADFSNFRLRAEKEKMQWSANAQLDIIKKLLPTIDMFDRAFQESAKSDAKTDGDDQLLIGFSMIHKNFIKTLTAIGVEPMTDYMVFDPTKHEAIMQVDSSEHNSDDIVEVLEKGYTFKGVVIRPAKVSVAR